MNNKFTSQRKSAILKSISLGASHQIAAESAGIDRSTLSRWLAAARKDKSGKFHQFGQLFRRAEAQSANKALQVVDTKLTDGCIKTAMWILERKHDYGKDNHHTRLNDLSDNKKEVEETNINQSLEDILKKQLSEIKHAMVKALKKESFQAYSALNRQYLNVVSQLRIMSMEEGDIDQMSHLDDNQLIEEITGLIRSLPPVATQKIIDELQEIKTQNNVIPLNKI